MYYKALIEAPPRRVLEKKGEGEQSENYTADIITEKSGSIPTIVRGGSG
jgi:hypothetical protein